MASDGVGSRRRIVGLAAAAVAASLAVLAAPSGWEVGPGTVTVEVRDQVVATAGVEVGAREPVEVRGRSGDLAVALSLPGGVPADALIEGTLAVERGGERIRPDPAELAVTVERPDGSREPLPLLGWDPTAETLDVRRQPPIGAATALGLLAAAVVLWVTVAVPLFATALMIPVVLAASGVMDATAALAPFFNPIIALFFAGFLMAEAMRRVGLDRWAAGGIVAVAGRGPVRLLAALMGTAAFLSMWMSNTAAVAVLIPIALAVTAPVQDERYTKVVVLATAYAATVGGVGSAIGTPANLLAIEFLDTFGVRHITFAGWFAYGLPVVVALLPIIGAWLWWREGVHVPADRLADIRAAARRQRAASAFGADQRRVLGVFGAVAAGWLTQPWHGLHPGVVALAGAVALTVTGDVHEQDLGRISWTALLTFGGGLTLGLALTDTGVAGWVASRLGGLSGLDEIVAVGLVAVVTLLLTTVASNTASAATLIPLAIPLAGLLGVDVTLLVVVVAIASSVDFALIIGTPPTMMAYSTGLYRPVEILRAGAVLDLVGVGLLVTLGPVAWRALGAI